MDTFILANAMLFLSTLSLRRATTEAQSLAVTTVISIHALLAESDTLIWDVIAEMTISIHALLAESDRAASDTPAARRNFYPRSPCGERPVLGIQHRVGEYISIHALLAESDHTKKKSTRQVKHFYPRSPCGERLNGT